ncbi:MAG: glutamine amidotransferase [Planctomycetaceae bacterium]
MANSILYLGDTALGGAAAYLAGVMTRAGLTFDYRPSDAALRADDIAAPHALYVLSDYAAKMIAPTLQERIVENVARGAGLLMLGGWETYCGLGGDWTGTPIAQVLPVEIATTDDRRNCDDGARPLRARAASGRRQASRRGQTPIIGGFNEVRAKPNGELLLTARRFRATFAGDKVQLALACASAAGRWCARTRSHGRLHDRFRAALGRSAG